MNAHLAWDVARAGGLVGFGLLTVSVCLGLVLSMRLTSSRWPRFVTNDLHQYLAGLTASFLGIHIAGILLDPYAHISVLQSVVPFTAAWRPVPLSLGIIGFELLLAVWASSQMRARIGYRWWRRMHYATFAVFVGALLHGVYSGTDTHQPWVAAMYALAAGSVGGLLAWRISLSRERRASTPGATRTRRTGPDPERLVPRTVQIPSGRI